MVRQSLDVVANKLLGTSTYEFEGFGFADVPDQEFTVSAFGIPESVSHPAKVARSRGLGYWFLGFALIALAAAVAFKIASSRLSRERNR